MLILTRRIGEAVVIGDVEVTVTVLGVKGNQVRLGFHADAAIPIHREEIYQKIKEEKSMNEQVLQVLVEAKADDAR